MTKTNRSYVGRWPSPVAPPRGFSLIEVLVALFILTVGVLGAAALQTSGLRANQVASQRSEATMLAQSMMEDLRANRERAVDGDFDIALNDPTPSDSTNGIVPETLREWRLAMRERLPDRPSNQEPTGSIDVDDSGIGVTATVQIAWGEADPDSANGVQQRSFTYQSRL